MLATITGLPKPAHPPSQRLCDTARLALLRSRSRGTWPNVYLTFSKRYSMMQLLWDIETP